MIFIMDMIKGVFIGIANIIPGVSGGTMAVSLGIYDKLIAAISNLLKNWKKSVAALLPIMLGCALGIVGFTYLIEYLLSKHTFVTCMAFVGLILGGIPVLVKSLRTMMQENSRSNVGAGGGIAFVVLFAIAVSLSVLSMPDSSEVLNTFSTTPGTMISLFFVGIIASATMVIPGVSGSLVMMILGYYYGIIETIKSFLDALKALDMAGITDGLLLLVPFGIGVLLGIFLIAKLITFLFDRYGIQSYCAILGLIAASPFAIFYNTGLFKQLSALTIGKVLLGILLAVISAVLTNMLGKKEH